MTYYETGASPEDPSEGCIEDIDGVGVLCNEVNVPGVVKILGLSAG